MGGGDTTVKETEEEKAQAEVAMSKWDYYNNELKKYENEFMAEVDNWGSSEKLDVAENLAIQPLASAYASEGSAIRGSMHSAGINPNSGKSITTNRALSSNQAAAEVDAGANGVSMQHDRYISGLQSIVAMGQGQSADAISGLTDIAQTSQTNAINKAGYDRIDSDNIRSAVGLAVGAGTSYGLNNSTGNGGA